jgi:uncharacterized lipoprotein
MKITLAGTLVALSLVALSGCDAGDEDKAAVQPSSSLSASAPTTEDVPEEMTSSIYCDKDGTLVETIGNVTTTTPNGCATTS